MERRRYRGGGVLAACAWAAAVLALSATSAPAQNIISAPLSFAGLTLAQAEDQGLKESPDVAVAQGRLVEASAALARARAAFGPSLIASYTRNPQAGSTPQPAVIEQHAFTVGVQTTLGNVAGYVPALVQAQAAERSARYDTAVAERTERAKITNLYYGALQARAASQVRAEALSLAQAQLQAAQRRFSAGDAPRIDVVRAQVAVGQATADNETAMAADANATEALALEVGMAAAALQQTSAGSVAATKAELLDPNTAVSIALAERADVASARADVQAAQAALRGAQVGLLPTVTVGAGYQHGTDSGQPIQGPIVNASFELPLNASASSQISAQSALLGEAQARLRGVERQVRIDVGAAVRNLRAAIQATVASTQARQAAQEELNATQIGYRTGVSSSLERSVAASTYATARLAELTAIYNEATARAVLQLELGS